MLFLLNGVAKLKDDGRMAIIQNGSSLFKGDAGSGESEIRGYLLENDWLEAIVQLPNDLFYNTGIATYIWVITKAKNENRRGKVQLIDASACADKRRKPLGNKRVDITERCRDLIMKAFLDFADWSYDSEDGALHVESKVLDNDYFKYTKLTTVRPLRLTYHNLQLPEADKVKKADREYLQTVIDTYLKCLNNIAVDDFAFFTMLNSENVKATAAQIKLIRTWLGTKDPEANEVFKKPLDRKDNEYEWDSELSDTEIIPWQQDIEEYLDKNVRPYAPDFQVDESKTKIGYEIPFTREFYKYIPLRPSSEIFAKLQQLSEREQELMTKILG